MYEIKQQTQRSGSNKGKIIILFLIAISGAVIYLNHIDKINVRNTYNKMHFWSDGNETNIPPENISLILTLKSSQTNQSYTKNDVVVKVKVDDNQYELYTDELGQVTIPRIITNTYYTFTFEQGISKARIYNDRRQIKITDTEIPIFLDTKGFFDYTHFRETDDIRFDEQSNIIILLPNYDYKWDFDLSASDGIVKCPTITFTGDKIFDRMYLWTVSSKNIKAPEGKLEFDKDYKLSDESLIPDVTNQMLFEGKKSKVGQMNLTLSDCLDEVETRIIHFNVIQ
jgi:hypothetical protein